MASRHANMSGSCAARLNAVLKHPSAPQPIASQRCLEIPVRDTTPARWSRHVIHSLPPPPSDLTSLAATVCSRFLAHLRFSPKCCSLVKTAPYISIRFFWPVSSVLFAPPFLTSRPLELSESVYRTVTLNNTLLFACTPPSSSSPRCTSGPARLRYPSTSRLSICAGHC